MSGLFQVTPQFHTLSGTTEIDPKRIPEYPVSERLRGIEGRNLVGQPWDVLAAQADKAKQAEEKYVALRYAAEETGIPEGHVYALDRTDPHVFDEISRNQQGTAPGPLGYTPPSALPPQLPVMDMTANNPPSEAAPEAPEATALPMPALMPPTAPPEPPAEVALIRNVGARHEQLQSARRFNAAIKIQRLARHRRAEMDQELAVRRLIAGAEPPGPAPDQPATVAAGGTMAIGAEDERRTVVGYIQQAAQIPEERYTPEEFADLINVENHAAKVEMLGKLLTHATDEIPFQNHQIIDMDFFLSLIHISEPTRPY